MKSKGFKNKIILSAVFTLLLSAFSFAQPANDNCANAIPINNNIITSGPCLTGSNLLATVESFEAGTGPAGLSCWLTAPDNTVWYTFTPPNTASYSILASSAGDSQLKILAGTCGSFTAVACNEDAVGLSAQVTATLTGGATYYVQVDMFDLPDNFCLSIDSTSVTTPPNPTGVTNDCVFGAIDITPQINLIDRVNNPFDCYTFPYHSAADQVTSSDVNGNALPCDGGGNTDVKDRWYTFTITPNTPNVWLDVYHATDFVTALYSGTPTGTCGTVNGLSYIDCSDGSLQGGPRDVGAGTTPIYPRINCNYLAPGQYYFRVWEYNGGPAVTSDMNLCIESGLPIGVTSDSCPTQATIGLTCGIPNTDVDEKHTKLSNAGTIGNANNTSLVEPQVIAAPSGQFQENCVPTWFVSVGGLNNVINNTAIYRFDINASGACVANPIIEFTNMLYGGVAGASAQVQVMNNVCAGGSTGVMTGSTNTPCLTLRPGTAVGVGGYYSLPNGSYYLVVDGQNGQLIQYDLRLQIRHLGVGCVPAGSAPSQPIALGAERCGPGTVNLTASGCAGGTLKWYNTQFGGTALATGANFTTPSISASRAYYVACQMGTCESARTLVYATIKPNPLVSVFDSTICVGGSIDLIATPETAGGTYLWSPGGSTGNTLTISPTSNTNYIVEYTLNGCSGKDTAHITTTTGPSFVPDNRTICAGQTITLNPTVSPTGGTYIWSPGSETTPTKTITPSTTSTFVLKYSLNGCTLNINNDVTVNPIPTVVTNDTSICLGNSAYLHSTVSPTGGTYLWTPGGQTTSSKTVTPTSTVNHILTYTLNGCSKKDTSTVTIIANPTVTSNSVSICPGSSGSLTATGSPVGGTYTWSPGGAIGATLTASPSATTTYTVTYSNSGCVATGTGTITVTPAPTATVSGGGTICSNQTATVNIALTGAGPWNITYSNGTSSTTVNGISSSPYTFNTNVAGNYTVTAISNAACTGTSSGSANVTVSPNITVTNIGSTCNGSGQYTVTFEISGGDPATYSVTPAGTISGTAPYTFTSNLINSGTAYSFNVTDAAACNPITVSGNINCTCPATAVLSGGGSACAGDSVAIVVDLAGTAPFTYTYTDGTTPTSRTTSLAKDSIWISTSGTFSLSGMSDAGCAGSISGTATVDIKSAPAFTVNEPTICDGETANVTATPTIAGGTYLWTGPGAVAGQTTQSVSVAATTTEEYYVTYTLDGCSRSDSGLVTVNPIPTVTVPDQTICEGTTATIAANGAPAGGTYLWDSPASVAGQTTASVTDSPMSNTTYTVTYTLNGCSNQGSGTVLVSPTPVISVSPATSNICSGESVTLDASSTAPGGTYNWTPAGLPTTGSITVTPNTTTTYTVTHQISGCTSNTESATINVSPGVTATASNNGPACEGVDVNLFVNTTAGATYSWSGPNGYTSAQQNPTLTNTTANMSGTYIVTVSANGCSATSSTQVGVSASPVISISPANPTICAGESVTMNVNSTVTGGTYNWTPAGLPNASSVTVTPNTTTTYTVQQVLNGGCASNTATSTITVNPSPTATPSSNSPICEGDDLNLSAAAVAGATYAWSGPNFTSTQQNPVKNNMQVADGGSYVLTVTAAGCSSQPVAVNVNVNPVSQATIDPAGPFCDNDVSQTLTSAFTGGNWTGNGITNGNTGAFDPSIAGSGTHTITYTVGGACPNSETLDITVNAAPSLNISATPQVACDPATIAFNATSTPAATSMNWSFGDGQSSTDLGTTNHAYGSPGTFNITLVATAGNCSSTLVEPNFVTINPSPLADFKQGSSSGTKVSFLNSSTGGDNYTWIFEGGTEVNEQNPSYNFNAGQLEQIVTLIARTDLGCTDTITKTIVLEEDLLFFIPNAFSPNGDMNNQEWMPVMVSGFEPTSYSLKIYNRWGELIFESNDHTIGWDGTYQNILSEQGIYTWTLRFTDVNTDRKYNYEGSFSLLK